MPFAFMDSRQDKLVPRENFTNIQWIKICKYRDEYPEILLTICGSGLVKSISMEIRGETLKIRPYSAKNRRWGHGFSGFNGVGVKNSRNYPQNRKNRKKKSK